MFFFTDPLAKAGRNLKKEQPDLYRFIKSNVVKELKKNDPLVDKIMVPAAIVNLMISLKEKGLLNENSLLYDVGRLCLQQTTFIGEGKSVPEDLIRNLDFCIAKLKMELRGFTKFNDARVAMIYLGFVADKEQISIGI